MSNPRFDCFKWNSICNTALEILIQTQTAITGALSADESKSCSLIQPPHRAARRPAGRAFESARAVYAARGSGAHTRAWPQNRASGTHAGVDRGDGIVTDGGEDVEHTHYCEDCEIKLAVLYDDREDESTALVCGHCGGTNTRRLVATDGGTDTEAKTVSVRLDDPEIVAALESAESQSEAIRNALRETYADESDTDRDGDVPPKAAEAYDWLIDYCGVGGRIGIETARSLIAQKFQIKTDAVDNLVIRPLNSNDWIGVDQGIQSVSIVVKPKPVNETAPEHLRSVGKRIVTDGGLVAEGEVTDAFLRARLATAYRTEGEIRCDACDGIIDLSKGSLATAIAAWNDHVADCGGEDDA